PHKTAIKQLQGLWRKGKNVFPNATIYIPIIQFSDFFYPYRSSGTWRRGHSDIFNLSKTLFDTGQETTAGEGFNHPCYSNHRWVKPLYNI
ncbi:MAG: hypothetical protein ACRCVL_02890, partial [Cetobacterium sp.]